MARAEGAGLLGVHARPADVFVGRPDGDELARLDTLRAGLRQAVAESVDPGRLASALTHFELWREELPSRVPFLPLSGEGSPGRLEAARYNDESLALYAASALRRGSLQRGRIGAPIAPDTVTGYVSALRALLTRDGGVRMLVPEANVMVPALARAVRRARPPAKPRRKRRGLRSRHLRAAAANPAFQRRESWQARRRCLAAVAAHVLVARGGELGRVDGKEFTPGRGLLWRHVQWHGPGEVHQRAACTVHLCSVKDVEGRGQRYPIPILSHGTGVLEDGGRGGAQRGGTGRRGGRGRGGRDGRAAAGAGSQGTSREPDALCAYELLREAWAEDVRLLGEEAAREAPIFRRSPRGGAGEAYETRDVTAIVREVAAAAGDDPSQFGAHSARIGGATDFRDLLGPEAGKRVLKVRGRWKSDIFHIYTRAAVEESLEASAGVAGVTTRDIESIFAGYTE